MTSPHAAVETEDLGLEYPARWRRPAVRALQDLDLRVEPGEMVGLLGPNGSGKSSLLEILAGNLRPSTGRARVLGDDPTGPHLVRRVGYQPDGPLPFPRLTGRQFLAHTGSLLGLPAPTASARAEPLLDRLGLLPAADRPLGTYSTGMAKRLNLAAALLAEPEVLLLDEPTAGLDPRGSLLVLELLEQLRDRGTAILCASHHLQEVEQTCSRVYLLQGGRLQAEGSLEDLLTDDSSDAGVCRLEIAGLDPDRRREIEAAVRAAGGTVQGWHPARRHLFALFRELEDA